MLFRSSDLEGDVLHQFDVPHPLVRSHFIQLHLSYILRRHPFGERSLCVWELVAKGDPFDPDILQADAILRKKEGVPNKGRLPPARGQADLIALGVHPVRPFDLDPGGAAAQGAQEEQQCHRGPGWGEWAQPKTEDGSFPMILQQLHHVGGLVGAWSAWPATPIIFIPRRPRA